MLNGRYWLKADVKGGSGNVRYYPERCYEGEGRGLKLLRLFNIDLKELPMTQFAVSTTTEQTIYAALELSKNSWLLAIQLPGRDNPSLHPFRKVVLN